MSTFRYRATDGVINIAANTLTAVSSTTTGTVTSNTGIVVTQAPTASSFPLFIAQPAIANGSIMYSLLGKGNAVNDAFLAAYTHVGNASLANSFQLLIAGGTASITGTAQNINISGRTAGTLVAKPAGIVGEGVGSRGAFGTAFAIENSVIAPFAVGPNLISVTLNIGHWVVYWSSNIATAAGATGKTVGVVIDGVAFRNYAIDVAVGESGYLSGSVPVDITVNGTVVRLDVVAGAGGASQFTMSAVRIG